MLKAAGTSLVRRVGVVVASASALALPAPSAAQAAPTNVTPPTISGALEVEHALTASTGTWTDASPIVNYAYQWLRCVQEECTDIDYATANPYTLPWSFGGYQAEVTVTATDARGESSFATSEVTDIIVPGGPRYTVSESVSGNGSVTGFEAGPEATSRTADANLACPGACGTLYPYVPGTRIELVVTPAPGSAFLGWGAPAQAALPHAPSRWAATRPPWRPSPGRRPQSQGRRWGLVDSPGKRRHPGALALPPSKPGGCWHPRSLALRHASWASMPSIMASRPSCDARRRDRAGSALPSLRAREADT